jgi:hypothetical protein
MARSPSASDDWLADFDNDGIADLAIGRLPVRTVAEAQAMIKKLAAYEQSDAAEEALLVSDRNDGYNFEAANAALKPLLPANVRAIEVKRSLLGDQAAKSAVIDGINRGQRIVNYAGHGSMNSWRGNVFTSTDALQLQNQERPTVFVIELFERVLSGPVDRQPCRVSVEVSFGRSGSCVGVFVDDLCRRTGGDESGVLPAGVQPASEARRCSDEGEG